MYRVGVTVAAAAKVFCRVDAPLLTSSSRFSFFFFSFREVGSISRTFLLLKCFSL